MNKSTLIATSWDGHRVFKYVRTDTQSLEWTKEAEVEIKYPRSLMMNGSHLYVVSDNKKVYSLNIDLKEEKIMHENDKEK